MTTYFVTRHAGAIEWAARRGIAAVPVAHLAIDSIAAGDTVIGNLPMALAAEVIRRGARYLNLELQVPAEARGKDLSADEMENFGARLQAYMITTL